MKLVLKDLNWKVLDDIIVYGAGFYSDSIVPEQVTSILSVPTREPDDSRCVDACATLVDESQDTKPVSMCSP